MLLLLHLCPDPRPGLGGEHFQPPQFKGYLRGSVLQLPLLGWVLPAGLGGWRPLEHPQEWLCGSWRPALVPAPAHTPLLTPAPRTCHSSPPGRRSLLAGSWLHGPTFLGIKDPLDWLPARTCPLPPLAPKRMQHQGMESGFTSPGILCPWPM